VEQEVICHTQSRI